MNELKTADIKPTGTMIPAQPGEQPPETKIEELDRAQLNEAWQEARAAHNALVALNSEQKRLDAEKRAIEAETKLLIVMGQQLDQQVQQILGKIREQYNIPDGWTVDAKTGLVAEPKAEDEAGQPTG